jgi:hypothetical protein
MLKMDACSVGHCAILAGLGGRATPPRQTSAGNQPASYLNCGPAEH